MGIFDRNKIEQFLQWEGGQRLFNFAYSVGAAIVILGALFKILHLPGGNTMLMIGMGTEVVMFLITAFDRPPKEYKWENVYPQLREDIESDSVSVSAPEPLDEDAEGAEGFQQPDGPVVQGGAFSGTVIIGGGGGGGVVGGGAAPAASGSVSGTPGYTAGGAPLAQGVVIGANPVRAEGDLLSEADAESLSRSVTRLAAATEQLESVADLGDASREYMSRLVSVTDELRQLSDTTRALNAVSQVLLDSFRTITENSAHINDSAGGYVEQMQALNHNVAGLNHIYEIQLRSVSGQLDAIDRVNRGINDIRDMYEKSSEGAGRYYEETEKMARHMRELNRVYENMLHAMTVNMYHPMGMAPGVATPPPAPEADTRD